MRTPLDHEVANRIRRRGPIPFAEVMDLALYDPDHGFYATGGSAGRRGDFITSPEIGPLFGALLARALDDMWHRMGEPDPFLVVEAGAGIGTLARAVLAGRPACGPALTYVLVEVSAAQRQRHREYLPLVEPATASEPSGSGPRVVSLAELPAGPIEGVVLANELLDNLPVTLVECHAGDWYEVRIGLDQGETALVEHLVPVLDDLHAAIVAVVPDPSDVPDGARIPLALAADAWLHDVVGRLERGRLIVVDYGDETVSLARRPPDTWLRTYRGHERGGPVLSDLGTKDITVDIPLDQVMRAGAFTEMQRQAETLRDLGIEDLVAEGRQVWEERAHLGDLEAIKGRSRIREAEALLDPTGLGAFWVLRRTIT